MTIKLHVGYVGVTREGKRVEIKTSHSAYLFEAYGGERYTESGYFSDHLQESPNDIIGPWVEPMKSPIETVTQNKLVEGLYGGVWVSNGIVGTDFCGIQTQAELEAAIETLILIRDAKVMK